MIDKVIEGSVTKTPLNKLSINLGEYELSDTGVIIRNYGPTMIYLLFKIINPATRIGVSNLKDEN